MKKYSVVFGIILVVLFIYIIGLISYNHKYSDKTIKKELGAKLSEIGKTYYEEFYYDKALEGDPTRLNNVENGIKIDLSSLSSYEFLDDFFKEDIVNKRTNEKCDYDSTLVIIYPDSPYKKSDYHIETVINCGIEN